jgi:hypothetical protein
MSVKFKNGDDVRQILPAPITGKVVRFVFDETSGNISYIVQNIDSDGVAHERAFSAEDLEAIPTQEVQ